MRRKDSEAWLHVALQRQADLLAGWADSAELQHRWAAQDTSRQADVGARALTAWGAACRQSTHGSSKQKRILRERPPCVQAPDIDSDVFVEVLGCLATLSIPGFDWHPIIAKHDLVHFLTGLLRTCTECGMPECNLCMHAKPPACWGPE